MPLSTTSDIILDITNHGNQLNFGANRRQWYVCVTIPAELRQSFKGQKQIKRSTGTSDKRIAENRRPDKTYEIFRDFESGLAKDHP